MVVERTSGRYVRQAAGYRAFIPAPLPPIPGIEIDAEMQALLSRADRALGRLDGSIQTLPNPGLFVFMYVRKEAVLSSQIEGTQASINDLLEVEARVFDPKHPKDVGEVLNYVLAMNHGMERLETLPLSLRLLREIHERLMQGVRGNEMKPGEFRTSQNWIGPQGGALMDASYVPPPHGELLNHLGAFETFLHVDIDMPPLIKIGLAHAQFETIHPFLDGNGRVGRLLITFLLCQQEILTKPVLYISHYLKGHRQRYYELLQGTRDNGDWEAWLKFFLAGVSDVSNEATETARRIVNLREGHRQLIARKFGRTAGNAFTTLEHLYRHPIITVNEVAELLGTTYQSANNLMAKFHEEQLVQEVTGHARNRRFSYSSFIRLFSDGGEEAED
ncbi:MAG: Fic family protein [Proteobacteria bacterium]|nr:Fic family protein [Pseudomonadota bacterium]